MKIINKKIVSILLIIALVFSSNSISVLANQYDIFNEQETTKEQIIIDQDFDITEKQNDNSDVLIKEEVVEEKQAIDNVNTRNDVEKEEEISTYSNIIIEENNIKDATNSTIFATNASESETKKFKKKNYGHRDPEVTIPIAKTKESNVFGATPLPSSYDARNEFNSNGMCIVPPIRDQYPHGTCWAHATMGMMETSIRKQDMVDNEDDSNLSEAALAYFVYNLESITNNTSNYPEPARSGRDYQKINTNATNEDWAEIGGSPLQASLMLSTYMGAVKENEDTEYSKIADMKTNGLDGKYAYKNNAFEIVDAQWINKNNIDLVKQAIMENGSAGIGYFEDRDSTNCHQSGTEWYYYHSYEKTNHDVMIIGWDDNISKDLFYDSNGEKPANNGGWLVRNSWGDNNNCANHGYFWISYEDPTIGSEIYSIKATKSNTYKYNYHYDGSGALYYRELEKTWAASNVFQTSNDNDQQLEAVNVAILSANSDFSIEVYTKDTEMDNPIDGTKQLSQKATKETAGVYTIVLDKKIKLNKGSYFSIIIKNDSDDHLQIIKDGLLLTKTVIKDGVQTEVERDTFQYNEAALKQSYIGLTEHDYYVDENVDTKTGNSTLTNINGINYGYNYRIKALTNVFTEPAPTPTPLTNDFTLPTTWYDETAVGKAKSEITDITISKYPDLAPTTYDATWNITGSSGLVGYLIGTDIIIYAPGTGTIYLPEDSSSIFSFFSNVQHIYNLNNLDTSNVTNMSSMFEQCQNLIEIDLSSFDTSNVTDMSQMFSLCRFTNSINVSTLNTSKVKDFKKMFFFCSSINSLDVSKFDTSQATDMYAMFDGCHLLASLNVSNFNTSNVTDMSKMFSECRALKNINLTNFDTKKVTSLNQMFYFLYMDTSYIETIDLSSFDTSEVTSMAQMFYNCTKLKTIIVSDKFVTTKLTENMSDLFMFEECNSLVGGNGTTIKDNPIDKTYARIDGLNGLPGYFTGADMVIVTFDLDGKGTNFTSSFAKGSQITAPTTPTYTGYNFVHWYEEGTSDATPYDFSQALPADASPTKTLKAKWSPISYKIYYKNVDGSTITDGEFVTKTYDSTVTLNVAVTKTGYKFDGWFTDDATFNNPYDGTTDIASTQDDDKNIYAKWTPITYYIKYELDGHAANIDRKEKTYGSSYTLPTPTRVAEGYKFDGWFKENTHTNAYDGQSDLSDTQNDEITIYARWQAQITYNANNHGTTPTAVYVILGQKTQLPSMTNVIGWTFDTVNSWYGESTCQNLVGQAGTDYTVTAPKTLFAKWKENEYSIIYNKNGGEWKTSGHHKATRSYTENLTLPTSADIEKVISTDAYEFAGWWTLDGTTTGNWGTQVVTIPANTDANTEVFAKWKSTVSFNTNGHGTAPASVEITGSTQIKLEGLTADGYVFGGWYDGENWSTSNKVGDKDETVTFTGPKILYAKWTPITYTIIYKTNEGTLPSGTDESFTKTYGDPKTLASPSKTGYKFAGWFIDNNTFKNRYYGNSDLSITQGDTKEIFANWAPITYKINYSIPNDIKATAPAQYEKTYKGNYTPANPTNIPTGYRFVSWHTASPYTDANKYTGNTDLSTTENDNITIYSKWEVSFTYNSNGHGTAPTSEWVEYQKEVTIASPTEATGGFGFDGWFSESTGGTSYGAIGAKYTVNAPAIAYAHWTEKSFDIIYHNINASDYKSGYTAPTSRKYSESKTLPKAEDVQRVGYDHDGWYENDGLTGNKITQTPANYAGKKEYWIKWKEKTYKINYMVNEGVWDQDTKLVTERKYTEGATLFTTISKRYHSFGGWYESSTFEGTAITTIPANTDKETTVFAKWIPDSNTYTITFDSNYDGTTKEVVYSNTEDIALRTDLFTRNGYTFSYWRDEDGNKYDTSNVALIGVTLYAEWTQNPTPAPSTNDRDSWSSNTSGNNGTGTGALPQAQAQTNQQQNQTQNTESHKVDNYQIHTEMIKGESFVLDPATNKMKISNQSLKAGFYNIDTGTGGAMYCIDENGNMKTGLVEYQGNYYYMDERQANLGRMFVGEVMIGNFKFVFDSSGKCVSGKENLQQALAQQQAQQALNNQQQIIANQQNQANIVQQMAQAAQAAQQLAQQQAIQRAMQFAQFSPQNAWNSIINMIGTKPFLIQ